MNTAIKQGFHDLSEGLQRHALWRFMAFRELKLRYARSFLGPFWITLSMGFWVGGLTLLYGGLFGAPLSEIAPFITLGVIAWTFLSAMLNEGAACLISAKGMLTQSQTPISTFMWLVLCRNMLVAGHHLLIFFLLVIIFGQWPNANWFWFLIGMPIILSASFGLGLLLAVATPRYRDLLPLIGSVMTVGFFLSPVMWRPSDLTKNSFIADFNPFTHLLAVFREPLLGQAPSTFSLIFATATAVVTVITAIAVLGAIKRRVIYWL